MNFQITTTAAQEILAAAARSNAAGLALRVAARQMADFVKIDHLLAEADLDGGLAGHLIGIPEGVVAAQPADGASGEVARLFELRLPELKGVMAEGLQAAGLHGATGGGENDIC